MAYINNDEINQIRAKADIVDVISNYITLEKKGKDYKCICPFHDDHSPSMSISVSKQIFKCFVCGVGGNVFNFVERYENVSFAQSVKIVADKIGFSLSSKIEDNYVDKFKKEHEIMELASKFYQNNLSTSSGIAAKKYLLNRKIDDSIIKEFNIGLSTDNKDDLYKLLSKKGYDNSLLESLGLINVSNSNVYDFFTGRITFPINDIHGNVVGFSSRIYRGEENTSKYVNTKETKIYIKGNNLFNYHKARGPSKKEKSIILVEGQMDAIRVYSSGVENVVALMGTALTDNQIDLIKKLNVKVILCLDGDEAGEKATIINGNLLTNAGISVQVVRLSDYKDPDEYIINKGINAFKDNLVKPIDYIDFKMKVEKKKINFNNSEELATYINSIIVDINKEKDPILKELTIKKISEEYSIGIDILKSKLKTINKEESIAKEVFSLPSQITKEKIDSLSLIIRKLLYYMMCDKKYVKIYQDTIGYFEEEKYRFIANEIAYYSEKNNDINIADFISYISSKQDLYKIVLEIIDTHEDNMTIEEFNKYIDAYKNKLKDYRIKRLKAEIKKEMDVNKQKQLLEEIAEIKRGSVIDD